MHFSEWKVGHILIARSPGAGLVENMGYRIIAINTRATPGIAVDVEPAPLAGDMRGANSVTTRGYEWFSWYAEGDDATILDLNEQLAALEVRRADLEGRLSHTLAEIVLLTNQRDAAIRGRQQRKDNYVGTSDLKQGDVIIQTDPLFGTEKLTSNKDRIGVLINMNAYHPFTDHSGNTVMVSHKTIAKCTWA